MGRKLTVTPNGDVIERALAFWARSTATRCFSKV